jgi:formamidopyrimidine-DNA glycosylase
VYNVLRFSNIRWPMPELPEVETVRLGLAPALEGHVLTRVAARRADLRVPLPDRFVERLTGRRMLRLRRRAKFLLLDLDNDETLIMHLGMSGRFTVHGRMTTKPGRFHNRAPGDGSGEGKHDHVVFETEEETRIVYTDHRRFGLMLLAPAQEAERRLQASGELGPEPLEALFTSGALSSALAAKKTPIKSALLDQSVVAGLGNIYVCEALFRSGISPKRLARTVAGARCEKLVPAIKAVLADAIKAGGSSLRDYAHADGELGYFQHQFSVYDREGEPCLACGAKIKRIVQAGRSTFFCAKCQR